MAEPIQFSEIRTRLIEQRRLLDGLIRDIETKPITVDINPSLAKKRKGRSDKGLSRKQAAPKATPKPPVVKKPPVKKAPAKAPVKNPPAKSPASGNTKEKIPPTFKGGPDGPEN